MRIRRFTFVATAIGAVACVVITVWAFLPHLLLATSMERCDKKSSLESKADCWDGILRKELKENSLASAFSVFKRLYRTYPDFVYGTNGCHQRAHLLGDAAYFDLYLGGGGIQDLGITSDIDICSWGFVHGFMEHLTDNNPNPAFIAQTCTYMQELSLAPLKKDAVFRECVHGAGHGLMLAQADVFKVTSADDAPAFFRRPYGECDIIPGTTNNDRSACKSGTTASFFYLYAPMIFAKGGIVDVKLFFDTCASLRLGTSLLCYEAIGWFLTQAAHDNPALLAGFVTDGTADKMKQARAFEGGMTSITRTHAAEPDVGATLIAACDHLPPHLLDACAHGIARGIGFDADRTDARTKRDTFCASSVITDRALSNACLSISQSSI